MESATDTQKLSSLRWLIRAILQTESNTVITVDELNDFVKQMLTLAEKNGFQMVLRTYELSEEPNADDKVGHL